jgi:hypothetical protein
LLTGRNGSVFVLRPSRPTPVGIGSAIKRSASGPVSVTGIPASGYGSLSTGTKRVREPSGRTKQ